MSHDRRNTLVCRLLGVSLTASGVAHFVVPDAVVPYVTPAFPDDPRTQVFINGVIETVIGVGLLVPRTRVAATVGAAIYAVFLVVKFGSVATGRRG